MATATATTPPVPVDHPPDDVMADRETTDRLTKKLKATKRSFADTVSSHAPMNEDELLRSDENDWAFEDPDVESDTEMDEQSKSDGRPRVHISKALRKELCQEWRLSLIIKFLGKNANFNILNQRVLNLWQLQGKCNLIDIGFGCFIARFDNRRDYLHVLLDGPWKIFGSYLVTQRWVPEFKPRTAKISKMAVWIRLPELPVEYFRDDIMKLILENVGKPLKLDRTTMAKEKGRFARAAVEIDLDQPLVSEIWVRNEMQIVEYESLHVVCFECGVVGHREQDCPYKKSKAPEPAHFDINVEPVAESDRPQQTATESCAVETPIEKRRYGSWMLVPNKPKQPVRKKQPQQNNKQAPSKSSNNNKYKVLASDPEEEVNALNSKDAEPAPRESSKGSKGKSPSIPNYSRQTPNQGKPPENRPRNREMPASSSKGRGGSQTAFRGKGRGQGRNGSSNQPRRATLNEWFDHLGSDGVFQFGRSQPSTSGQERDNGTFTGSAQPLRSTPGEGGNTTSSPSAVPS